MSTLYPRIIPGYTDHRATMVAAIDGWHKACEVNHSERQNGIADYNDLAATLRDAAKDFTIDFKPAVLAALIRIEERLAQIESKGCSCS